LNKHLKRYDILNETDGWARYYPAQTRVKCGLRLDDDRLAGKAVEYKLVINMDLVIDADKRYGFRPFSNVFWEGTRTGQIGYNLAPGTTALLSKEFQAPGTGSFDPHSLTSHTHPGAQSLKLMAKRLGGQSFAEPQCLFTLQYPVLTVEPGWQSQLLNVKPGPYVRQPTFNWSEIGLKWLSGNHSKSGIDGNRPCAFQKGDTFFFEAVHAVQSFTTITMMTLRGTVFWTEQPQWTFAAGPFHQSGPLASAEPLTVAREAMQVVQEA